MIARFEHGAQRVNRGHAAGEHARGDAAFKGGQVFFEASAGGVGDAGVFVSFILAEFFLQVRGGGVDGHADCAGFAVGFLTHVNGASGEAGL